MADNVSGKWKKKRGDQEAGLVFDWRASGVYSWRVWWMLIPAGIMLAAIVNVPDKVLVSDPNLYKTRETGIVFFLRPDWNSGRLGASLLPRKTPVWAEPFYTDDAGRMFDNLSGGLDEYVARPKSVDLDLSQGLKTSLLMQLSFPNITENEWIEESSKPLSPPASVPSLCVVDDSLAGWFADKLPERIPGGDFTGFQTSILLVVSPWGVPELAVVTASSGNEEADLEALRYMKQLRWSPAEQRRSGLVIVNWKEVSH